MATYVDIPANSGGSGQAASVRVVSTANITLSGTQTIDGVAVIAGDRVLVADQSTASQNGIYTVAAGAWTTTSDWASPESGMAIAVTQGTTNAGSLWILTTPDPITVGVTNVTFAAAVCLLPSTAVGFGDANGRETSDAAKFNFTDASGTLSVSGQALAGTTSSGVAFGINGASTSGLGMTSTTYVALYSNGQVALYARSDQGLIVPHGNINTTATTMSLQAAGVTGFYSSTTLGGVAPLRFQQTKGADIASANTVTLGTDGNYFSITGTTTVNGIVTTNWQAGARISLRLASGITITNNSGAPGSNAVAILLRAGANLTTAAAYLLELWYDGTNWIQPN